MKLGGKSKVGVIILAAGVGARAGGIYKQFVPIAGKPTVQHSLDVLLSLSNVHDICVVVPPRISGPIGALKKYSKEPRIHIVSGASERYTSMRSGLAYFREKQRPPQFIIVHDAVRPLLEAKHVMELVAAAEAHGAALFGVPAIDTIGRGKGGFLRTIPKRQGLYYTFTPHCYDFKLLCRAYDGYEKTKRRGSPENSELVSMLGVPIKVLETSYPNIKLTYPADIDTLSLLLSAQKKKRPRTKERRSAGK